MTRTRVRRYRGALAATLLLAALGLLYAEPRLFAAAAVPLAYVTAGALSSLSGAATPEIERSLDPASPPPGERVTVTLTVRNPGESALPDVRVVDGVPDELAVVSGSPRGAVSLRPGEQATVSYEVVAKRGDHDFDDPAVRVRTATATDRATTTVAAAGETTLSCARSVSDPSLARASPRRVGTHTTDAGGEGLEFHSTREYRSGDPLSRIDWRRFAKSGELTTVRFRQERAARTVVVADVRPVSRVSPSAGYPNAAALSVYAAERLHDALVGANVATDVTALGLSDDDVAGGLPPDDLPWAASDESGTSARLVFEAASRAADRDESAVPGDGTAVPRRGESVASTRVGTAASTRDEADTSDRDGASAPAATDGAGAPGDPTVRRLLARLPADAQVVLVSPVLDDWPVELGRSLAARGHDLAVLSPDATDFSARSSPDATGGSRGPVSPDAASPGRTVAGTRRAIRHWDLRAAGATTVDWDPTDPLGIALERSLRTLL